MKTARRKFMVPIPKVPDLDALNERLLARCLERLDALEQGEKASALLADLDALRDLPGVPFEACEHVRALPSIAWLLNTAVASVEADHGPSFAFVTLRQFHTLAHRICRASPS